MRINFQYNEYDKTYEATYEGFKVPPSIPKLETGSGIGVKSSNFKYILNQIAQDTRCVITNTELRFSENFDPALRSVAEDFIKALFGEEREEGRLVSLDEITGGRVKVVDSKKNPQLL